MEWDAAGLCRAAGGVFAKVFACHAAGRRSLVCVGAGCPAPWWGAPYARQILPDEDGPGDMKDSAAKAGSNRNHQSVCVCMRVDVCIARAWDTKNTTH